MKEFDTSLSRNIACLLDDRIQKYPRRVDLKEELIRFHQAVKFPDAETAGEVFVPNSNDHE